MFSSRKIRSKASPVPEQQHRSQQQDAHVTLTPQSRRRVRPTATAGIASPITTTRNKSLPLYHNSTPGSSTCNHFLLGGHYYPGKDKKKRYNHHQKTLWYRIFCSSPWRLGLTTILVAYIFLWYMLVPGAAVVLEYGKHLAGRPPTNNNDADTAYASMLLNKLPPIEVERQAAGTLKEARSKLRGNYRQKVLEQIVPTWYHRNDNAHRLKDHSTTTATTTMSQKDEKETTTDDDSTHDQARRHDEREIQAQKTKPKTVKRPKEMERHDEGPRRKSKPEEDDGNNKEKSIFGNKGTAANKEPAVEQQNHEMGEKRKHDGSTSDTKGGVETQAKQEDNQYKNVQQTKPAIAQERVIEEPGDASNGKNYKDDEVHAGRKQDSDAAVIERTLHTIDDFPLRSQCPGSVTSVNTTLLIQCSIDRMWILNETCQRWHDPIVIVVHTANNDTRFNQYQRSCPQMTVLTYVSDKNEKDWQYPVNKLRNLGLDAVQTSHVMLVDVDFVPSQGLDESIRQVLIERQSQRSVSNLVAAEDRDAIVVPAFERLEDCSNHQDCSQFLKSDSSYLPKTIENLRKCVNDKHCTVFQAKNNWEGHHSTNSQRWLKGDFYESEDITLADESKSKLIKRVSCFDSLRYEPYVVIRWCSSSSTKAGGVVAPYYDERFYGYGKNKIQMISHLRILGYQFSILPMGFIVHNPHAESNAKKVWNDVEDYKLHEQMDSLYPQFLQELVDKYKGVTDPRIMVQPCTKK